MAVARLISAGEQAGPRRAAIWSGNIALREVDAVLGDRVDVRRRDVLAPLKAELAVADVIAQDEQDVRFLGLRARGRGGNQHQSHREQIALDVAIHGFLAKAGRDATGGIVTRHGATARDLWRTDYRASAKAGTSLRRKTYSVPLALATTTCRLSWAKATP